MTIFEQVARVPRKHPIAFHGAVAALIVVLSLIIYKGTWTYSYLDWDDNTLVEQNVYVMNPKEFPTAELWTPGRVSGPYLPLRTWSYLFDREFIAKDVKNHNEKARAHHVMNTWLYVLNGLVLFAALRKLLDPWTAALAALIWVAHPVHVEGVAWVSGRKEMLSGFFMVSAFLTYMLATERNEKAAPRVPLAILSMAVVLVATVLFWNWVPLANRWNLGTSSWKIGLVALGILLVGAGIQAIGARAGRQGGLAVVFSILAVFCAAMAMISKPVAVVMPAILICWELGHRPLRDRVTRWNGRLGTTAVLAVLAGTAVGAYGYFVKQLPVSSCLTRAIVTMIAFAGVVALAGFAQRRLVPALRDRISSAVAYVVPTTEETLGMLVRSLPFICVSLYGMAVTVQRAATSGVIKEATWNAAPKSQSVSGFAAIWLDVYHLLVPLNLSALYDVKSDEWHYQAVLGVIILIALPIATAWVLFKSPKSLVWIAWLVAPIIPVSGIVRIAAAHADRYLYLPAIAAAVGLAYLLATAAFGDDEETGIWERWVSVGLMVAILGGFTALSIKRADVWKDDVSLWGDAVEKNPKLPSALNNYGAALMNARKVHQALEVYYRAYEALPTLDVAQFNIAATELKLGRPDRAEKYALEFVAQHPEMPTGWMLLGQLYNIQARNADREGNQELRFDRLRKAEEAYRKGCDLETSAAAPLQRQDNAMACAQRGLALLTLGNTTGMEIAFQRGMELAPESRQVLQLRSKVLKDQKRHKENHEVLLRLYKVWPAGDVLRAIIYNKIDEGRSGYPEALKYTEDLLRTRFGEQKDLLLRQRLADAIAKGTDVDLKTPGKLEELQAQPSDSDAPMRIRLPGGAN